MRCQAKKRYLIWNQTLFKNYWNNDTKSYKNDNINWIPYCYKFLQIFAKWAKISTCKTFVFLLLLMLRCIIATNLHIFILTSLLLLIKIYILNPIRKDEIYTHSFKIPFSKHHFNNQNIIRKNKYLLKFITVT